MSIARHHAEWLSLVPVSGPFLSLPVLMEAFNTGLEPHDPEHVRLLRQEYANWQESLEKRKADPAVHYHWIKFVLTKTLDLDEHVLVEGQAIPQALHVEVPEHHELLRPSIVVTDPSSTKARLLVQVYPRSQELTSYVANSAWKASPDTRMTELLHGTGVRLGLITNGEHWMLVDAPKAKQRAMHRGMHRYGLKSLSHCEPFVVCYQQVGSLTSPMIRRSTPYWPKAHPINKRLLTNSGTRFAALSKC